MIPLNSEGPSSKSLPDIEITRTDNGAKIEQTPDLRNAAVEQAAAEKRVAQEANELKTYVLPNGLVVVPVTAQQISTGNDVAEIETVEKPTEDRDFENDEDSEELLIMLEGLLSAD